MAQKKLSRVCLDVQLVVEYFEKDSETEERVEMKRAVKPYFFTRKVEKTEFRLSITA